MSRGIAPRFAAAVALIWLLTVAAAGGDGSQAPGPADPTDPGDDMRPILIALALTALPAAAADPPPPPPAVTAAKPQDRPAVTELKFDRGPVKLTAPTACVWYAVDPAVWVEPFPDGRTCLVIPPAAGRFRVLAYTAKGDLPSPPAVIDVVLAGPTVPPPPPKVDPFEAKVREAYQADPDPADVRKAHARILVELYRQAAELVQSVDIATGGQLTAQLKRAADTLKVTGLVGVRTLMAAELGKVADPAAPLTPDARERMKILFLVAAQVLAAAE
jgi:hypothetical protein